MSDSWDDYADSWDEDQSVQQYALLAFEQLQKQLRFANKQVLDFGCGTGQLTSLMAASAGSILAVDTSQKMLDVLDNKGIDNVETANFEFDEQQVTSRELTNKFDLITASSVLAFVDEPIDTLTALLSSLKPGGAIVQWDWLNEQGASGFGFTEAQLKSFYFSAGFDHVDISMPFSLESKKGQAKVIMAVAQK